MEDIAIIASIPEEMGIIVETEYGFLAQFLLLRCTEKQESPKRLKLQPQV